MLAGVQLQPDGAFSEVKVAFGGTVSVTITTSPAFSEPLTCSTLMKNRGPSAPPGAWALDIFTSSGSSSSGFPEKSWQLFSSSIESGRTDDFADCRPGKKAPTLAQLRLSSASWGPAQPTVTLMTEVPPAAIRSSAPSVQFTGVPALAGQEDELQDHGSELALEVIMPIMPMPESISFTSTTEPDGRFSPVTVMVHCASKGNASPFSTGPHSFFTVSFGSFGSSRGQISLGICTSILLAQHRSVPSALPAPLATALARSVTVCPSLAPFRVNVCPGRLSSDGVTVTPEVSEVSSSVSGVKPRGPEPFRETLMTPSAEHFTFGSSLRHWAWSSCEPPPSPGSS